MIVKLNAMQNAIVDLPAASRVLLEGPAGAGKTTAAVQRLLRLLKDGTSGGSILVLVPQRTLAAPYSTGLRRSRLRAGGLPSIQTAGGLARRMVELFWPLAAGPAGFADPDRPPTFLTLETAQYHMAHLVRPLLDDGAFESITIDRNRLYSQIIDNLNKAAVVGFPHSEIDRRLATAWSGDPAQARVYADAQRCANIFRRHCLDHNLLDFSLQVEVFWRHLWPLPICREHLLQTHRHLIVDNMEEDTPFAHDLLSDWLPAVESALLIYDQDAGYRQFLGADPQSGYALRDLCNETVFFSESLVTPPELQTLNSYLAAALEQPDRSPAVAAQPQAVHQALQFKEDLRFYP
ncbi:MAG TPA: DEAD/DEAH box helicase, partial [Anaerolineae bacterium]|nr:DEAD/DEAH box helicase [Anaerolineae bacterium]